MRITIPGQTRAKKNGMAVIKMGPRYSLRPGKLYTQWEKAALDHLIKENVQPWQGGYPIEVCFFLFRDSRRRWDIDNVFCGTLDVLQQCRIIENDTMDHVIPIFSGWAISKDNPRVELLLRPITKPYFREDIS